MSGDRGQAYLIDGGRMRGRERIARHTFAEQRLTMLHRACSMLLVQVLLLAGDSDGRYVRFKNGRGRTTIWNNRGTGGSCLLDPPPADGMFVAMNKAALDNNGAHPAELCGKPASRSFYAHTFGIIRLVHSCCQSIQECCC